MVVDSGSTDRTIEIAKQYSCEILRIPKHEFSFGRSLNIGCLAASGRCLVITSGHCIPADYNWLGALCEPILSERASYAYGELAGSQTKFSERRIFEKFFPEVLELAQGGDFCNNANAALSKDFGENKL